jgi:hypothetical protein
MIGYDMQEIILSIFIFICLYRGLPDSGLIRMGGPLSEPLMIVVTAVNQMKEREEEREGDGK